MFWTSCTLTNVKILFFWCLLIASASAQIDNPPTAFGPWMGTSIVSGMKLDTSQTLDYANISCGGSACNTNVYTVPAGYNAWVNMYAYNGSGSTLTWYEMISMDGGNTYYLNGNGHTMTTGTGAKDNTSTSLPPGTIIAINVSASGSLSGLSLLPVLYPVSGSNPMKPLIFTNFTVSGDNVVYTVPAGVHDFFVLGPSGPWNSAEASSGEYVTNVSGESYTYRLKFKRSGGSSTPADASSSCGTFATIVLSFYDTILNPGDEIIVNSNAPVASITAWSITSNVVTFTATNSYVSGQLVNLEGFPTSTFFNGAQCTVSATGLTTSAFECPFTHANGSATEAGTSITGGQMFIGQIYEGPGR